MNSLYDVKDRLLNECSQDVRECKDCCTYCEINDTCYNTCVFFHNADCRECEEWRNE